MFVLSSAPSIGDMPSEEPSSAPINGDDALKNIPGDWCDVRSGERKSEEDGNEFWLVLPGVCL